MKKEKCSKKCEGKNLKQGFTLLELLVVIVIIGILAAIALPQYNKAVWKTRYVQAKTLARNIANSEEIYFTANGQYTNNFKDLDIDISPDSYDNNNSTAQFSWGNCSLVSSGTRQEVQCNIYKNGKVYLHYLLEFYGGTYFNKKMFCVAYGENGKPTSSEINYKVCQSETGDQNPAEFGGKSLSFRYQ